MNSKIKNIIIFSVITVFLILVYIFLIKKTPEEQNLVSSSPLNTVVSDTNTLNQDPAISKNLLSILLSVKSIKLDDSIFSNKAFVNLHDSSILLIPTGNEGRLNPFAPIGYDIVPTLPAIDTNTNSSIGSEPSVTTDATSTSTTTP